MDLEKAEVYKIMADMFAKMFLVLISSAVFLWGVWILYTKPGWPIATFDCVCGYSIGKVITHYFPARGTGKKSKKITVAKREGPR